MMERLYGRAAVDPACPEPSEEAEDGMYLEDGEEGRTNCKMVRIEEEAEWIVTTRGDSELV
jgi:hypothetical protein